jgi:hypothetical protein
VPQQAATIVKLSNVDDETYRDSDFSIHKDTLTISSKTGIQLNAIFYPSDRESAESNFHFCGDKSIPTVCDTNFLINNVKKRQDDNENDSLKGHYNVPQIPFINLFVSAPNGKHRPVML